MEVITLEDKAFFALIDRVVAEVREKLTREPRSNWINSEEAMKMLNISSKTTFQKFRDEERIRYSKLEGTIILYDRNSIEEYIELNAKGPLPNGKRSKQ